MELDPVQPYEAPSPTQERPFAHVSSGTTPSTDAITAAMDLILNEQRIKCPYELE